MCIRDRGEGEGAVGVDDDRALERIDGRAGDAERVAVRVGVCLLYTSDAADERSSVDLGGRRTIKKKRRKKMKKKKIYQNQHYKNAQHNTAKEQQ